MKTLFICASLIHKNFWFLCIVVLSFLGTQSYPQINLKLTPLDGTHCELTLDFDIDEYDAIYEQYLSISIDDPDIVMSKIDSSTEPTTQYTPAFKSSKSLFLGPCNFKAALKVPSIDHLETAHAYVTYRLLSQKHSQTVALALRETMFLATVAPSTSSGRTVEENHIQEQALNSINLKTNATPHPRSSRVFCEAKCNEGRQASWVEGAMGFQSTPELQTSIDIQAAPKPEAVPLIPLGILSILCAFLGIFLIFKGSYAKRRRLRPFAASLGMALIACSIVVAAKAYQALYTENRERLISIKK